MDILQYLIELLKTHKQIGIKGLGTLYKKKTPGRYDAETHSFLPPSYALEFTSDILEETNLVQFIQSKRGISADSAKYFVSQFVTEVTNGLNEGKYEIEGIGTFEKINEQISFVPNQDINTGFDFFALPSVTASVPDVSTNLKNEEPFLEETTVDDNNDHVSEPATASVLETEIEQVQVPEFEQEINRVAPEAEVSSPSEEPLETQEQENTEETAIAEEKENDTAEKPLGESAVVTEVEETQAAPEETETLINEEVFEEITEVNTENPTGQTPTEDENLWDFNGDNVISAEDIYTEDNTDEIQETSKSDNELEKDEPKGFKLTSTTQEWSFDSVKETTPTEENTLIGEFDNDEVEEEPEEEKRRMPLFQKLIIGIVALFVALVITYFIKPDLFQNLNEKTANPDQKMAVPINKSNLKTQQDSLSFADSIMQNAEKAGLDVQPAKDTLKVTTTKKEVAPTYTYDIIIASFATNAKAQEYISRMKKKGFDAKISTMHGKRKNISIASYNSEDSAQKYVAKYRKQFNNVDIYAQPIKNK